MVPPTTSRIIQINNVPAIFPELDDRATIWTTQRKPCMQHHLSGQKLYRVGEWAPPGHYQEVESRRVICLDEKDMLPPSFDGRIAHYVRVQTWGTPETCGTVDRRQNIA